jgi:hypothetical protein
MGIQRLLLLIAASAVTISLSACGPFGGHEGSDLVEAAEATYQTLPAYPGAQEIRHETGTGTTGESGPVTSGTTVHVFRLPQQVTVKDVEKFYTHQLHSLGWRLSGRERGLPNHRAGPVLNFDRGHEGVSINLEGGYDHALEVAVTDRRSEAS